jgi:hypothetical protein|tara:strand:+ start:459 stop:653 length:195 start_codon:yes stop_codon:yes gene_type:complete
MKGIKKSDTLKVKKKMSKLDSINFSNKNAAKLMKKFRQNLHNKSKKHMDSMAKLIKPGTEKYYK